MGQSLKKPGGPELTDPKKLEKKMKKKKINPTL